MQRTLAATSLLVGLACGPIASTAGDPSSSELVPAPPHKARDTASCDRRQTALLWNRVHNADTFSLVVDLTLDDSGNPVTLVLYRDEMTIGNVKLQTSQPELVVVKQSARDGAPAWTEPLAGIRISDVRGGQRGEIVLAARLPSTGLTFGGQRVTPVEKGNFALLALSSGSGSASWSRALPQQRASAVKLAPDFTSASSVADSTGVEWLLIEVGQGGRIRTDLHASSLTVEELVTVNADEFFVAGDWRGTIRAPSAKHAARSGAVGAYIARVDPEGNINWIVTTASNAHVGATGVLRTAAEIVWVGWFEGRVTIGDHTLVSAGRRDGFVAYLDAATGEVRGVVGLGGSGRDGITGYVGDGDGLFLAGVASRDFTIGGTSVGNMKAGGMFILRLSSTGNVDWSRRLGEAVHSGFRTKLVSPADGELIVATTFSGTIALSDEVSVRARGKSGVVVAKFGEKACE